jgi:putative membrane protein
MIDWRHWHNEPYLIGGLVLLGWLWAVLAGPWRGRLAPGEPFPRGHAVRFYGALLIFYVAVGSPLDQIGERYLFSAHMAQHQLLVYPAAILFLLGLPHWMVDPALARARWLREPLRVAVHPLGALIIYTAVVGTWHAPWLYDWALRDKLVHVVEHVTFFIAALVYWWPLLSPSRLLPRSSYGAQMLYLLAVQIAMTPVFAYVTFSSDILYPTYEFAPRLIADFTPAEDQLTAGVMMKLMGMTVSLLALTIAFWRWYRAGEPATSFKRREA